MQRRTSIETLVRRDRALVITGVIAIAALAWTYVMQFSWNSNGPNTTTGMVMPMITSWGPSDFALMLSMWAVMMAAMMLPTAAPMILMFSVISRRRAEQQQPFVPAGVFMLGYAAVWGGFAILATTAQWGLNTAALFSPMIVTNSAIVGGALLLAAGIFQWTPLKYTCLTSCRSPAGFITNEWREGERGAFVMGLRHGTFCLGCCWVLMGLLFVVGVMNLLWIAALSAFILVEKTAPGGIWISRISGTLLIAWGAMMAAGMTV